MSEAGQVGTVLNWTAQACPAGSTCTSLVDSCLARERAQDCQGFQEKSRNLDFYMNSSNFKRLTINSILFLKHKEERTNHVCRLVLALVSAVYNLWSKICW